VNHRAAPAEKERERDRERERERVEKNPVAEIRSTFSARPSPTTANFTRAVTQRGAMFPSDIKKLSIGSRCSSASDEMKSRRIRAEVLVVVGGIGH